MMADDLKSYERWGSLDGKRVLVRVDFNVPVERRDGRWRVTDDFRIRSAVPLFEDLLARGATVVACTHFGRPKGQVVDEYRVDPIRERLAELPGARARGGVVERDHEPPRRRRRQPAHDGRPGF